MLQSHFKVVFDERARLVFVLLAAVLTTVAAVPVFAAVESEQAINWGVMGMQLFGGLALFLFGMEQMADALKAVAGNRMKMILAKLTSNRFMGAITGAFVTAVIQSSSVTTVLVVGFITAGLMSMAQSVGVIMGANIGTTITAQIVAFKITEAAKCCALWNDANIYVVHGFLYINHVYLGTRIGNLLGLLQNETRFAAQINRN